MFQTASPGWRLRYDDFGRGVKSEFVHVRNTFYIHT